MANFNVDPVTRIEGHLSVALTGDTTVTDVQCKAELFRGFELIMKNRKPTDAPIITQRI